MCFFYVISLTDIWLFLL